jgi:hypothetical protein
MAAWRSGGFYALPFKFALPAAVAPNRSLAAVHFVRFVKSFYSFFAKNTIFVTISHKNWGKFRQIFGYL